MGWFLGIVAGLGVGAGLMFAKEKWFAKLLIISRVLLVLAAIGCSLMIKPATSVDGTVGATFLVVGAIAILVIIICSVLIGACLQAINERPVLKNAAMISLDLVGLYFAGTVLARTAFDPMLHSDLENRKADVAREREEIARLTNQLPEPYRYMGTAMILNMKKQAQEREQLGIPSAPVPQGVFETAEQLDALARKSNHPASGYDMESYRRNAQRRKDFRYGTAIGWVGGLFGMAIYLRKREPGTLTPAEAVSP